MTERKLETFEQGLLKLLTGSKFGRIMSVDREYTDVNLNSPLARPVIVKAKFFTDNGSVLDVSMELSSEDLEKLHEETK